MHPALTTANPFQDISVSPGDRLSSLPLGESEPSVTVAFSPGENTSDGGVESRHRNGPPVRMTNIEQSAKSDGRGSNVPPCAPQAAASVAQKSKPEVAPGPSDRFVLDEQAFMDAIEPPPLFLQPGYKFARRVS